MHKNICSKWPSAHWVHIVIKLYNMQSKNVERNGGTGGGDFNLFILVDSNLFDQVADHCSL